jgi:hypothetical protein
MKYKIKALQLFIVIIEVLNNKIYLGEIKEYIK